MNISIEDMSEIWRSGLTLLINLHSCAKYDVSRSFCSEVIENIIKFQYFYLDDNGQGQEYLTHIWQVNLCCLCAYVCNFFSDRLKHLRSNGSQTFPVMYCLTREILTLKMKVRDIDDMSHIQPCDVPYESARQILNV